MSLMNQDYAVPGRVLGVYRTVRAFPGVYTRDELARLMAPDSLQDGESGRAMVEKTVDECRHAGLFLPGEGKLELTTENRAQDDGLPDLLLRLFLVGPKKAANRDLGLSLAWFLAQPAGRAP